MSYPALLDFERDLGVTPSINRVYKHLRQFELVHFEVRRVKVTGVAALIHMQPSRASDCIEWLIAHKYLHQQGRDGKLRLLALVYDRIAYDRSGHMSFTRSA